MLRFAGLISADGSTADENNSASLDSSNNGNGLKAAPRAVRVGSFVQWTSQGVDRFTAPQRVVGIEGDWAFVEGSPTGLPMNELSVVDPLATITQPPANPFYQPPKPHDDEPQEGMALDRATLDEGPVVLRWPEELSPESVDEFEYWVNGLINRAKRKAGIPKKPERNPGQAP